ncbi:unnamed protein product, partial [Pelagomonas calceolata]
CNGDIACSAPASGLFSPTSGHSRSPLKLAPRNHAQLRPPPRLRGQRLPRRPTTGAAQYKLARRPRGLGAAVLDDRLHGQGPHGAPRGRATGQGGGRRRDGGAHQGARGADRRGARAARRAGARGRAGAGAGAAEGRGAGRARAHAGRARGPRGPRVGCCGRHQRGLRAAQGLEAGRVAVGARGARAPRGARHVRRRRGARGRGARRAGGGRRRGVRAAHSQHQEDVEPLGRVRAQPHLRIPVCI